MPEERARAGVRGWLRYAPIAFVPCGLGAAYLFGFHEWLTLGRLVEHRDELRLLVDGNPLLASAVYLAIFIFATACAFPVAALLTLFGGFLFGVGLGATLALIAKTVGATILFLAARTAFGGVLAARANGRFANFASDFRGNAFLYILTLRLAPLFPFVLVTLGPAIFGVRLKTFVAATVVGILPAALAYAWAGRGLDSMLDAARSEGREPALADLVTPDVTIALIALTLVALIAAVVKKRHSRRMT